MLVSRSLMDSSLDMRIAKKQIGPDVEAAIGDTSCGRCDPWFPGEDSSTGNVTGGRKLARYVLEARRRMQSPFRPLPTSLVQSASYHRIRVRAIHRFAVPGADALSQDEVFEDKLPFAPSKRTTAGTARFVAIVCSRCNFRFDHFVKRFAIRTCKEFKAALRHMRHQHVSVIVCTARVS
jgi:hypothetical protein